MSDFLTTESGLYLLQETGDKLLLEVQGASTVGLTGVSATGEVGSVADSGGDVPDVQYGRSLMLLGVG